MARKLGVDLATVHGSGPEGRILIEDLGPRIHSAPEAPAPAPKPPDYGKPGTRIKLQGLRRKIAEHMVQAKHVIPHYTYVEECDVTDLVKLRENLQGPRQAGVKLTYLAFFVKAVVHALKEVPLVNASLDEAGDEIVLHDRYHIGIAVATPGGLIVPVVHDADKQTSAASPATSSGSATTPAPASSGWRTCAAAPSASPRSATSAACSRRRSSTIPKSASSASARIVKRPVFDDHGQVRPADIIYLSLSFDHRVVDGAVGGVRQRVIA